MNTLDKLLKDSQDLERAAKDVSSGYNNSLDPIEMNLRKTFKENDTNSLNEAKETIKARSKINISKGAIKNPVEDKILDIQKDQNGIKNGLDELLESTIGLEPFDRVKTTKEEFEKTKSNIQSFKDHTDQTVANISGTLSTLKSKTNIDNALAKNNNPCGNIGFSLGSILGEGDQFLENVKELYEKISNQINRAINFIDKQTQAFTSKIEEILNVIYQITQETLELLNIVQKEVSILAEAILETSKSGISDFLNQLFDDPCLKFVGEKIIEPAAKKAIEKGREELDREILNRDEDEDEDENNGSFDFERNQNVTDRIGDNPGLFENSSREEDSPIIFEGVDLEFRNSINRRIV